MDSIENQRRSTQLTESIFEKVRNIASDLFSIPADRVTAESSPETIEAWDSTQHLNFVLALEEKFNLQLSPEEMEQMRNIGETVKVLQTRMQNVSHA
jgi:acyl carrier protein